jgi:hypothetical protein
MKTRLLTILVFSLLVTASTFAQDAMPTKEETVNYINKKLQETVGFEHIIYISGFGRDVRTKIKAHGISLANGSLQYSRSTLLDDGSTNCEESFTFSPRLIEHITVRGPEKGSVGTVEGKLGSKVGRYRSSCPKHYEVATDWFALYFLAAEKADGEKIKKALFHLRDLAKAEDDPFGN